MPHLVSSWQHLSPVVAPVGVPTLYLIAPQKDRVVFFSDFGSVFVMRLGMIFV